MFGVKVEGVRENVGDCGDWRPCEGTISLFVSDRFYGPIYGPLLYVILPASVITYSTTLRQLSDIHFSAFFDLFRDQCWAN